MVTKHLAWIVLVIAFTGRAMGQPDPMEEKTAVIDLANDYATYFIELKWQRSLNDPFEDLFINDSVVLFNDFSRHDTASFPSQYYDRIKAVFINNPLTHTRSIDIWNGDSVLYAKRLEIYYIWLKKFIFYKYGWRKWRYFPYWELLKIRNVPGAGLRIFAVQRVAQLPRDTDHDRVPDFYDSCRNSDPGTETGLNGCPIGIGVVADNPPIQEDPKIDTASGAPSSRERIDALYARHQKRDHPLSEEFWANARTAKSKPPYRFGLSLEGGLLIQPIQPFDQLLQQRGYTQALGLHWYISNTFSLNAGYQHLALPLNTGQTNGQVTNSQIYHLEIGYASLGIGTYKHHATIFSFEPLAGWAYSNVFFKNQFDIAQVDGSGHQSTVRESLSGSPFAIYGGKISLQQGLGKSGRLRLLITGYYFQGNSTLQPSVISNSGISGVGNFLSPPGTLRTAGLTVGMQLGMHRTPGFSDN